MAGSGQNGMRVLRILSAILLLVMGGFHLFLKFDGTGGILGVLFVLNAVAALVLAIGMLALRGRLFRIAAVLSLLFILATLASLLLALTVGLFGIHESWTYTLVPETIVVEAIGIVVLAITTARALRRTPSV